MKLSILVSLRCRPSCEPPLLAGSPHQMTQACYFVRGKCNYTGYGQKVQDLILGMQPHVKRGAKYAASGAGGMG